jgi:L-alanine-DL-glutamate epimerase-like enolase superfamily enzyme
LVLDMNAPYDVHDCIRFAQAVEPYDIFWLEEPLHWYLQPADYITSGAIRFVQFDATRHAGFTEALRIASMAEQHKVSIAPHTAPHIHGHLVSAFGASAFGVESHGDRDRHPIQHGMCTTGPEVRNGMVHLNALPGFGIEIDWAFVTKHRA